MIHLIVIKQRKSSKTILMQVKKELLDGDIVNLAQFSNLRAEQTLSTFLVCIYFYNNVLLLIQNRLLNFSAGTAFLFISAISYFVFAFCGKQRYPCDICKPFGKRFFGIIFINLLANVHDKIKRISKNCQLKSKNRY